MPGDGALPLMPQLRQLSQFVQFVQLRSAGDKCQSVMESFRVLEFGTIFIFQLTTTAVGVTCKF